MSYPVQGQIFLKCLLTLPFLVFLTHIIRALDKKEYLMIIRDNFFNSA